VPGNCCSDTDCTGNPSFGLGYACVNNRCTGCDGISSKTYYVDPVNGNDTTANGSNKIGGANNSACSFKTVHRALQVAGSFAAPDTKIVIMGSANQTVALDASETLPLLVPANVTITTQTGPISLTLPAAAETAISGFQLAGDQAALAPDNSYPLTIDGSSNTSGVAIAVAPGANKTATLQNVIIQNTGGNGITVSNGVLKIGAGVTVKNAGTALKRHDGLTISGGTVNINVPAGSTTSFLNNTQHGIYVTGTGSLNITATPVTLPAPNGQGSVVVSGNAITGVRIFEGPGGPQSTINGLVAWNNQQAGLRVYGGAKVKVRNGVFLLNATNGVYVTSWDTTAAGNDLSNIDLGTTVDPGHNIMQALSGAGENPNGTAGLCVTMEDNQGALTLHAAGNTWAGPIDCSSGAAAGTAIPRAKSCGGKIDVGVSRGDADSGSGTVVTVDVAGCQTQNITTP
jgi:hypothetical protein